MTGIRPCCAVVASVIMPTVVSACAVCVGDPSAPMTAGMNMGIFSLLGVIGAVLGSFIMFFIFIVRRSRALANIAVDDQRQDTWRRPNDG